MVIQELPKQLFPLQIIIPVMAAGMIAFGVITSVLTPVGKPEAIADLTNILLLVLALLAASEIPAFFIVRMGRIAKLRKTLSDRKPEECLKPIAATYLQITLIGAAMAEGIGLFGIVIVLITGNWLVGLAPLLALLVLVMLFPRLGAFQSFASNATGRYGM